MQNQDELLNSDSSLQKLYFDVTLVVDDQYKKALRRNHVQPQIAIMMVAISRLGNPTPVELAREIGRTPQTITDAINRMEKQGLIKKIRKENKKNSYTIQLTSKGISWYKKAERIDIFYKVIKDLSAEERNQLRACLEKMLIQVEKLSP